MVAEFRLNEWFDARAQTRHDFLRMAGWAGAQESPVGEDCAFRRYLRLAKGGDRRAILMEAVPDDHPHATPGHKVGDFIRVAGYLRGAGLNVPQIYAADAAEGYVLLEDFGDVSFKRAIADGGDAGALYALATDVLCRLRQGASPGGIVLPHYYESHVHKGMIRIVDWYMPVRRGVRNPDALGGTFLKAWAEIERGLPACPDGFLHIDFHLENLMLLPGRDGLNRCGILDFQGAMKGPQPYDLANLLEDARGEIAGDLRAAMLRRYCRGMDADEEDAMRAWYRVLATQFHCRVMGQFIRLALRDGKSRYLAHLPRLEGYMSEALKDEALTPLRRWFAAQGVDFAPDDPVRVDGAAELIRADAF